VRQLFAIIAFILCADCAVASGATMTLQHAGLQQNIWLHCSKSPSPAEARRLHHTLWTSLLPPPPLPLLPSAA